jgi:antagonist of KipI
MIVEVISPGMLTTVQDLGRYGYGPLGVSPAGAADPVALRFGNRLVGNPENVAVLEMTLLGGTFRFPEGAVVALTGAEFDAAIPLWTPVRLDAGATLKIGGTLTGARCYLCVRGGISVPLFLDSASTHILTGLGGRRIQRGDKLQIGNASISNPIQLPRPDYLRKVLRVTKGPQDFAENALHVFCSSTYTVTEDSNRMGLRLQGPPIDAPHGGQMISEGVSLGAIQIPAGGQPIILFVDQQTTGGYPKIANIITADLPSVGQLRPRDQIRFELIDAREARRLLRERNPQ